MTTTRLIKRLTLVMMLASLAWLAVRVAGRGRFAAPYSSYGAGPEGTLALFQLTRELGFKPQRLAQELTHMPRGTLFTFAGCHGRQTRALLRPEREELARWVAAGGLLIVAGAEHYAPEESGIVFDSNPAVCAPRQANSSESLAARHSILAVPAGPPLTYSLPLTVHSARAVRATFETEATTLLNSELGPLGMTAPLGRGRVVVLGTLDLLTNQGLPQGGAAVVARVLEAFAPAGPVWFDEYHLGLGERRSLIHYFRERKLAPGLIQLCLLTLVFLLARAQRLGKVRNEEPGLAPRRHFRDAMATLYGLSTDKQGTLAIIVQHSAKRIACAFSFPPQGSAEELKHFLHEAGRSQAAAALDRILRLEAPLERHESMLTRSREIHAALHLALADADSLSSGAGEPHSQRAASGRAPP